MIREKRVEGSIQMKPGSNVNGNMESSGTPSSSHNDSQDDSKSDRSTEIKEEGDSSVTDIQKSLNSPHNSPLDDVKASPQPSDKEGPSILPSCKIENGENSDPAFPSDSCDGNFRDMNLPSIGMNDGVQPLPSNVNKQSSSMETQYMQQQSQIFVFSTSLANKASEAVLQGQFPSIIAYHCSQPRTKKYLEGNGNNPMPNAPPCPNMGPMDQNSNKPLSNMLPSHSNPILQENMLAMSDYNAELGAGPHQPLTGVKVPDENLTPQQRQHREEQLATLRKMQQMLFPEALSRPGSGEGGAGGQVPPNLNPPVSMDEVIMPDNMDMSKAPGNQSQGDWQKLQMGFYDDQKMKKGTGNGGAGGRVAGPPPSYQQATRSASVPIALPSPNPSSPNNNTSNLSLPSPRTCSGINSPADKVNMRIPGPSPTVESPNPSRNASSNPPTPVSHLSPKHKDKLSSANEFSPSSSVSAPTSQHSPVENIYCRPVQAMSQSKPAAGGKEPNLMPVPSPQQIQYLNAFEGQELTIQKQPNTSLKESGRKSPGLATTPLDSMTSTPGGNPNPGNNGANPNTGNTSGNEMSSKLSGPPTPSTPDPANRSTFSSDVSDSSADKSTGMTQRKLDPGFCNSPQGPPNFNMTKGAPGFLDSTNKSNDKDLSNGNFQCMAGVQENVPLNPNGVNRISVPPVSKSSHFDPISSLAQMSQQLTSNVPNSPVNQPSMMPNMHQPLVGGPFNAPPPNSPHMLGMNELHHLPSTPPDPRLQNQMPNFNNAPRMPCSNPSPAMSVSPKLVPQNYGVPQRPPVPRNINYNGASVQVKPNAPNTIQYLPSRPQPNAGPRGPPSLDFLQRFSNPLSNLDSKVPTHNLQYFPNNYPQSNINEMGICPPHGQIRGQIRNPNPNMIRMHSPQMSPHMGGFGNADMFPNSNCQMFGPGGNKTGMSMAPDATQPLPPSMGQANNFKNSSYIGPTTADPNYAQQFHNFQQQLYATNTRGQLNQTVGNNQSFFIPK